MRKSISRNLPGQLISMIGNEIIAGEILPGEIITSDALEARFGVSRTVVREAMKVLNDKGLIRARTKIGTIVLERSEWNLLDVEVISWLQQSGLASDLLVDLDEVRASYEPSAARLAAQRRRPEDIATLEKAFEAMREAFKKEGQASIKFVEADLIFHRTILAATQNELMKRLGELFLPLLGVRIELVHPERDGAFILDHQAVLAAITNSEPDAAEAAMKHLIEDAREGSSKHEKEKIQNPQGIVERDK